MANTNSKFKTQSSKLKLRAKKLTKFGVLFGLRESYLLAKNVYGLYSHPFLTTKKMMEEKDWSQEILIFGLPIYLWLGWIMVLIASRIFIFQKLQFGFWAKTSSLVVSFLLLYLLLLLGYWILKVRRGNEKN